MAAHQTGNNKLQRTRAALGLSALQQKLFRELWQMRSQVVAIILVIVGGVGVCVMSLSTYDSLISTRDSFYRDYGFAHVFANLKRAPQSLLQRIEDIPGVAAAESRVVATVNLEIPGFADPVTGLLTSVPDKGQPNLNRLHLLSGRLPDGRRDNEILISDAFAEGQKLTLDDKIIAIINGRRRELRIVGIALSPDHIYQIAPGSMFPDYQHFGVLWMAQTPLSSAYDMEGAFNDVVIRLQRNAHEAEVLERLDNIIDRYGGQGSYGRDQQLSNMFLKEEFSQLKTMAYLFPVIFLGVAIFLLNIVVGRLVSTQREIIAVLKAFGYSNQQIAWHYAQLILIIVFMGVLGGFALGVYLGQLMTVTYTQYFRFPLLLYTPTITMFTGVGLLTILAALLGTLRAVYKAASLPPAEAMRPEPPQRYRKTLLEKALLQRWLSPSSNMVLRHLQQKPGKTLMSIIGMAMATAIMMVGNFQSDAVKYMVHAHFKIAQKQDISVTLYEPVAASTLSSFTALPGVYYAEGIRSVSVRLQHQQHNERTLLQGLPDNGHLQQILDRNLLPIAPPEQGLMVTEHLAHKLGFEVGDEIMVELLQGNRRTKKIVVTQLPQQFLGMGAYMRLENLNRLIGEGPAINSVLLSIDPQQAAEIYKRLRAMPRVSSVNLRQSVIDGFNNTTKQVLLAFTFINALLGAVIAFGVVYNTIRIALAERARELASMRVLGYTHGEVAYVLLNELGLLTLVSLPLGILIGSALCLFVATSLESDMYRIPLTLSPLTFALSALIVVLSALASGVLVWRRLRQLDLVEVLKTRE